MSDFWSGVVAAGLGAIIGGGFTAWAARSQVKGAFSAALAQVHQAHRLQRELAIEEHRQGARAAFHSAVVEALHDLVRRCRAAAPCPHDAKQLDAIGVATLIAPVLETSFVLQKIEQLYQRYLTCQEQKRFYEIIEDYGFLAPDWVPKLFQPSRHKYDTLCLFHSEGDGLAQRLEDYASDFAESLTNAATATRATTG